MIDLHMHTTASDGRSEPAALVAEAAAVGCHTIAVTDHDTVAAVATVRDAGARVGIRVVSGIEMTAVEDQADIHILGYFIDIADPGLAAFLERQRAGRRERVAAMGERLRRAGVSIDIDAVLSVPADSGRAVGRPAVARALIDAGYARDMADAFGRFLAEGRPGYLPRRGAPAAEVVERIRAAGGLASVAHPGKMRRDHLIQPMIEAGMGAIEVYHSDHTVADVVRYQTMAERFDVLVTGGSDYHGPGSGRTSGFGYVGLPPAAFERLSDYAARAHTA